MIIEYYKGSSGSIFSERWYWRIKARNGKIVANGAESYSNKGNVLCAIDRFLSQSLSSMLIKEIE